MFKFVLYFVSLFVAQVAIGLLLDVVGVVNSSELALPFAGLIMATIFLRGNRLAEGLARVRADALLARVSVFEAFAVIALVILAGATVLHTSALLPRVGVTILAATAEETFLRAVPLLILAASGAWTFGTKFLAVVLSSTIFLVGHDLTSFALTIDKFVFAVIASVIFLVTSRLWLGIALHGITNVGAVWYFSEVSNPSETLFAVVSIAVATGGLLLLLGLSRRQRSSLRCAPGPFIPPEDTQTRGFEDNRR